MEGLVDARDAHGTPAGCYAVIICRQFWESEQPRRRKASVEHIEQNLQVTGRGLVETSAEEFN